MYESDRPEFGTGANAAEVAEAVSAVRDKVSKFIGSEQLLYILDLAREKDGPRKDLSLSEREARIIRFAMNRALESL